MNPPDYICFWPKADRQDIDNLKTEWPLCKKADIRHQSEKRSFKT